MAMTRSWLQFSPFSAFVALIALHPTGVVAQTTATGISGNAGRAPTALGTPAPITPRADGVRYAEDRRSELNVFPVGIGLDRPPTYMTSIYYPWLYGEHVVGVTPMTVPLASVANPAMTREEILTNVRGNVARNGSAVIEIQAPATATVLVEHERVDTRGELSTFTTPPLAIGRTYTYEIHATWHQDSRLVDETRRISVSAGDELRVKFTDPREPAPTATLRTDRPLLTNKPAEKLPVPERTGR